MARNTTVKADHNAPAITEMLAKFVVNHPSRGWDDNVEREAHRTFANWVGCAIGPSGHETVQAALAAVNELSPAPQASLLGAPRRWTWPMPPCSTASARIPSTSTTPI
jgi:2-methylcitrate dehydratase PrpD